MRALLPLRDLLAGLSVAGLILPEGVAYAGIAGIAPAHALAAAIFGGLAYAMLGKSRFAIVAPTSSSAAILAAALASFGAGATDRAALAVLVVLMTGAILLAGWALRLGNLSAFVSRPVLRGFAFGLALTIVIRQLPHLLGLPAPGPGNALMQLWDMVWRLPQFNPASAALGLGALAALLGLRRWRAVPASLLVLAGAIALALALPLQQLGVALVGTIPLVLAPPQLPALDFASWSRAAQLAAPIALMVFAESWGSIRSLAMRHGDSVSAGRELAALGGANLVSALVQGLPVGAGFSASSAAEASGAQSRMTSATAAIAVLLLALLAGGMIAHMPEPVLAAVVIAALSHALSPQPFGMLARLGRDQWIAGGAVLGVLLLGVLNGMLAAVTLSLIALLRNFARPKVSTLGRIGADGRDYVDAESHPEAVRDAAIGIYRPNVPLFFANAEAALGEVARRAADDGAQVVIVSLEESSDIDSTAAEALGEFVAGQNKAGRPVIFARLHDAARMVLARAGLAEDAAEGTFSVADAVVVARRTQASRAARAWA